MPHASPVLIIVSLFGGFSGCNMNFIFGPPEDAHRKGLGNIIMKAVLACGTFTTIGHLLLYPLDYARTR